MRWKKSCEQPWFRGFQFIYVASSLLCLNWECFRSSWFLYIFHFICRWPHLSMNALYFGDFACTDLQAMAIVYIFKLNVDFYFSNFFVYCLCRGIKKMQKILMKLFIFRFLWLLFWFNWFWAFCLLFKNRLCCLSLRRYDQSVFPLLNSLIKFNYLLAWVLIKRIEKRRFYFVAGAKNKTKINSNLIGVSTYAFQSIKFTFYTQIWFVFCLSLIPVQTTDYLIKYKKHWCSNHLLFSSLYFRIFLSYHNHLSNENDIFTEIIKCSIGTSYKKSLQEIKFSVNIRFFVYFFFY